MDRGTDAADTVVTYLFLYLLPAIGECVAVCVVFLLHFGQWDLALLLFASLLVYGTTST
jgi:ABC-type transport system involved in Fe-S cluster assembly fused permease/ATPase subunit